MSLTWPETPPWGVDQWAVPELAHQADSAAGDVSAALELAVEPTRREKPAGTTGLRPDAYADDALLRLRALATVGAVDLTTARVMEPHVDALTILAEAGDPDLTRVGVHEDSTFGVFAANGPGHALQVHHSDDGPLLTGTKPWCSLADRLTHALITASDQGHQRLFAVALDAPTVSTQDTGWVPMGLRDVSTLTLQLRDAPAVPVGDPGWYLSRPGFWWGGIGVAAVWFGAAAAVAGRLIDAGNRREPDQIALMATGACDLALTTSWLALQHAAHVISTSTDDQTDPASQASQASQTSQASGPMLAARVRAVVAKTVEDVLTTVGHATGPAPLAYDARHAQRVADLTLYVRQHHAERDLASLGRLILNQ